MPDTESQDSRYIVISSDNHAGADLLDYKPYLEKKWHEEFDEWAATYTNPWDFMDPRLASEDYELAEDAVLAGGASWHSSLNWDSAKRIAHMDQDGVAGEVIFPNTAPPFMPGSVLSGKPPASREEYERRWAGLQAHNRWLSDFCGDTDGRRAGVAQILLDDVDDAVAEVRRIKDMGLIGGVLLPMESRHGGTRPLYDRELEPLWQVCADLDVAVNRHAAAPPQTPATDDASEYGIAAVNFAERQFFNHRCVAQLIYSGVLERNPTLKVVLAESGSAWVPSHLAALDGLYQSGKASVGLMSWLSPAMTQLSMRPSDYFHRNFYLGASLLLPSETAMRHDIGVRNIMWGSDYPHSEGTHPYSRMALSLCFAAAPTDEVAAMVGLNAGRVYGFDLDELRKTADRIGPTVGEIHSVPTELPTDSLSPVFTGLTMDYESSARSE